jgi:hypothetical protein
MDDAGLPDARYMWPFSARDTSLRCLYRIYEWASIGRPLQVGYETQYFWDQTSWKVEDIPDPNDPDPVRYAVLAGFAEIMAICFNERIDLGLLRKGSDAVTSSLSSELRRSLSREQFISFTKEHHEKAPSWTAGVRGPEERFIFQPNVFSGGIFTSRNIEICGGGNMDWIWFGRFVNVISFSLSSEPRLLARARPWWINDIISGGVTSQRSSATGNVENGNRTKLRLDFMKVARGCSRRWLAWMLLMIASKRLNGSL